MKNILKISLLVLAVSGVAASCERDDNTEIAGKGGSNTLTVTAKHHGDVIQDCMIYIKYNTLDAPASYDDSAKCVSADGTSKATFTNLKKGKYYLYGVGYDPGIAREVKGGAPYTITADNQTLHYDVPVTEIH